MGEMKKRLTTPAQEAAIIERFRNGESQISIANDMGLHRCVIGRVIGNKPSGRTAYDRPKQRQVTNSKSLDAAYKRFKEEERKLPPDTRSRWEQWMPRPGRSALDQKLAQQQDDIGGGLRSVSALDGRRDDYRDRREVMADGGSCVQQSR